MYSGVAVRTSDITRKTELTCVLLDAFSTVLYECTLSQSAINSSLLPSLRYFNLFIFPEIIIQL